ncbi:MAG: S9 family peptidase [Anaerolineae bacterium]
MSDHAQPERRQYGMWESPITAALLAGDTRLSGAMWDSGGEALLWLEGRSDSGVLVSAQRDDAPRDLTRDLDVRAQVGYGGGDFTVADGRVVFTERRSGRLYSQPLAGGAAVPITPAFGKAAAPAVSPCGRWVAYVHSDEARVDRLAVVDAEGRSWPRIFAEGHDFFMQPRWSPDGRRLAWVAWDHPNMPWDGTRLYVADVQEAGEESDLPRLGEPRVVAGGDDTAVFQPEFGADGAAVYYVSDQSGWGQLHATDLESGATRRLTEGSAEHGTPAWAQDMRTYALTADARHAYIVRQELGFARVMRLDLETGDLAPVDALAAYTNVDRIVTSPAGDRVAVIGSAPDIPPRIVVHDAESGLTRVVARSSGENVPRSELASPEPLSWETTDGEAAHGLHYAPLNPRFESDGEPPLIVLVHGGPTSQSRAGWAPAAQFFATRGYAVLLLNYRGSTGYGRDYMLRLRREWGVCDVDDAVSGSRHLAEAGLADPSRLVIMGGSAGGFTVLQAMIDEPEAFRAGVDMYGVSNHFTMVADTHKFEERYLDSLLGELPEAVSVYRERSPVLHADRIRRPLAVFQGEIDQVVPRDQSDAIVDALRRSGTPHVYHVYEGEGHGFRKRETIDHFWGAVEAFLLDHVLLA